MIAANRSTASHSDLVAPLPVPERVFLHSRIRATAAELEALTALVYELADTTQRHLGFMTAAAKEAQDQQVRKDKRDQKKRTREGAPAGHGETRAPGNLRAIDVNVQIWATVTDILRRLRQVHRRRGTVPIHRAPDPETATVVDLLHHLAALVGDITETRILNAVLHDLEHAVELADTLIDGEDRVALHDPCPNCNRQTLVVTFVAPKDADAAAADIARCERDQHTGRFHPCVCPDPLCGCKVDATAFRHTWHRARPQSSSESWHHLATRITFTRVVTPKGRTS